MMVFSCGTIIADIVCRKRIGSGVQVAEVAAVDINLSHWFGDDAVHAADSLSDVNPDRGDETDPPCSCSSEGKPCFLAQFVDGGGSATFEDDLWEVEPVEFAEFLVARITSEDDWHLRWQ